MSNVSQREAREAIAIETQETTETGYGGVYDMEGK
jgi:hypothetical protein